MKSIRRWLPYVGIGLLALGLRLWMPGPVQITSDEYYWLLRSHQFTHAVAHGDFADATAWGAVRGLSTAPTMPGVTTMWAGTAGHALTDIGAHFGVNAPLTGHPLDSPALLRWSRSVVALACSVGIVLLAWLAERVIGRRAALVVGTLCAVEPWLVGHSFLLHTDALVSIYGACAIVAMAAAFRPDSGAAGRPGPWWCAGHIDYRFAAISAATTGIAVLTKLNALALVGPGVALLAAWELIRRFRASPRGERARNLWPFVGLGALWLLGAAIVFAIVWPAMWVQPGTAVDHLWKSFQGSERAPVQFFGGRVTRHPGLDFYPVNLAFRLSPWLLIGALATIIWGGVGVVARVVRRGSHRLGAPVLPWRLLVAVVPYVIVIATYNLKYDRYALPVVPILAIVVGVGVSYLVAVVSERVRRSRRVARPLSAGSPRVLLRATRIGAALAILATAGYTLSQAPWQVDYVDPVLGGQRRAAGEIMLGWDEGASKLGLVIQAREAGHCDAVRVGRPNGHVTGIDIPCGRRADSLRLAKGNYLILDINAVQRGYTLGRVSYCYGLTLRPIASTRVHGVAYSSLYQVTGRRGNLVDLVKRQLSPRCQFAH